MITFLHDGWHLHQELDLLDAGGGWVARIVGRPDGTVRVEPDPFGLTGSWKRQDQTLCIIDSTGAAVARFVSEGMDGRGRKLIWGAVKAGPHWIEHCLRVPSGPRPKISFCTVSRNRLHHVRLTLPQNIADNRDYPNLEFVLLDYNSGDGLGEWIRRELSEEIESGRLSYYLAPQPTHFHATHSRNMSVRLANGDIVCVVDADNYTGRGFAFYLADHVEPDNFLIGCRIEGDHLAPADDEGCVGRFALYKTAFLDVGGMDEAHVGWGYDDMDLYARLRAKGYRWQSMEPRYARCIAHDDSERRKELRYQDIGRDKTGGDGSLWVNARRSQANLEAGRIVLNGGRIGCGEVIKNFRESTHAVRELESPFLSICIACGGSSDDIHLSLPANLHATRFYPNLEIVLLDSPAGLLAEWLRQELSQEIDAGRIVYRRMFTPYGEQPCENPVRQRNMAARLATGDILCLASPADRFSASFAAELAHKLQAGWIHESFGGGLILSRHLFYLAEGLDQALRPGDAEADLLSRIERRLAGEGPPAWSRSGLETRDFGGGTVLNEDEPAVISPHRFPRVSFTTACSGNLHLLKRTLPRNLADNRDYPNLEHVLLAYGACHEINEWVRTEMKEPLESGRLVYYQVPEEQKIEHAHARNMAMRLATGELLYNVEADHATGHHFAFHVERIAMRRTAFYASGGWTGSGSVLRNFDPSPIEVRPYRLRKISFCVTCMDRLHHLSRTLPRNLADNLSYPDLEIVLLDYNSSDGLEAWAKEHLREWMAAGRLVYFRTSEPEYFHRSHSRNLAVRLATGEIVCTLDADNFTGPGFAHYVNERFDRYGGIYLRPDFEGAHVRLSDTFGRICVRKQDFLRIEGYDENLVDYGFEDLDLCARLQKSGLTPRFIEDGRFLTYIHHGNRDRVGNGPVLSQASVLLHGRQAGEKWESIVYLLRDGEFIWQGPRVDGISPQGRWQQTDRGLLLTCIQGASVSLRASEDGASYHFERAASNLRLRRSDDLDFFSNTFKDLALEKNHRKYCGNLELPDSRVNAGRFGQAKVSRNFSPHAVPVEAVERKAGEPA